MQASRLAGKEEIASSILHDVRNVLTSINISFSLLRSKAKALSVDGVEKAARLINDQADLRGFLTEHERGRKLPAYLKALGVRLAEERQSITSELDRLTTAVEHVQRIVSEQQSYAKVSGQKESVAMKDILEESLSLNGVLDPGRGWKVVRKFAAAPVVMVEKHKLLQILVNLIRNAKQACEAEVKDEKTITVSLSSDQG
jgi:signal transduction histidine kinase